MCWNPCEASVITVQTMPGRLRCSLCFVCSAIVEYFRNHCLFCWAFFDSHCVQDMFHHLNPVREGFGSRMLRKHGWLNGQPLGKSGEGYIEPVPITFKSDRKGTHTASDLLFAQLVFACVCITIALSLSCRLARIGVFPAG